MPPQHRELVDDQHAEHGAERDQNRVVRRAPPRPRQQRLGPEPQKTDELEEQTKIGEQEADAEDEEDL